jgi:oxalate---CoA ligase
VTAAKMVGAPHMHSELLRIWSKLLSAPTLSIDDDFFESGGDSLLATDMMLEIERCFGRSVPHSLLFEASTIRRLAEVLSTSSELEPKAVFEVTAFDGRRPLLFFHGDWNGGGFFVKRLTRALGTEQPIVAVAPHGFNEDTVPSRVEEMAADRLPQILAVQASGPYRLGGHCVGSIVALETARLLMESGEEVEFVAMIDPPWPASFSIPDLTQNDKVGAQYFEALTNYSPKPLSVPIIVFSSAFDGVCWRDLSPDFELVHAPGGHFDWVTSRSELFAAHVKTRSSNNSAV